MKFARIVRDIMTRNNVSGASLARNLNISSNALSQRFTQKNISIEKLNEMLSSLDYKIIAVPQRTNIQKGWYEIE